LRVLGSIETDSHGILRVHSKKAEMHWLETLPALIGFLKSRRASDVSVEYMDRV